MQFSLYSFGCSTLLKILVQWQKKIESFHQYMYDKKLLIWSWLLQNIVFCQLCLTDQLFALAFQLLKIIVLLPIHISPYFAQPCPTVVLITRMENQISSKNAFRHNFVPWNGWVIFIQPQVIRTPSFFHDTLMTTFWLMAHVGRPDWRH